MQPVPEQLYQRIDNGLFESEQESWWQPGSGLYLIETSVNPARVGYLKRVLAEDLQLSPSGLRALEVGCGGGLFCEEIARLGFATTGIDPAERPLRVARDHALAGGLAIHYQRGCGEALPHPDQSFDAVFCCDVLEHVRDLPRVISEVARVLAPGGLFFYDTINRTLRSKLLAIKLAQVWRRWAFLPPRLHVWEMFIKPQEMQQLLERNGLSWREHRGLRPNLPMWQVLRLLRQRAQGRLGYEDLGRVLRLIECSDTALMYLGYAIKQGRNIGKIST